jgi:hypothetical protein
MIELNRDKALWHGWLAQSQGWHIIDEIDLVAIIASQCDWLRLCARLESVADSLPAGIPSGEAASICKDIGRLADGLHDDFTRRAEMLLGMGPAAPLAHCLISHVAARDAARAVQAYDLIEALIPPAVASPKIDPETLGYMLRCFFEGCRQMVALERLSLLELGGDRLTAAARTLLTDRIIECCGVD